MKLNLRGIDLNLLPVFVAIMEHGQLSRAADTLGMSQPAISAALQRLRHTLGDALFVRTRSGMEPTPVPANCMSNRAPAQYLATSLIRKTGSTPPVAAATFASSWITSRWFCCRPCWAESASRPPM